MNLIYLRYFSEVARLLNISKAADLLFISQPALSRAIKTFEDSLGVKLFERGNRGLQLTNAGRILYDESDRLFIEDRKLMEKLHQATSENRLPLKILYTNDVFLKPLNRFCLHYNQNCTEQKFWVERHNWHSIRQSINRGTADISFGIDLVFKGLKDVGKIDLFDVSNKIVVSKNNPLAKKDSIYFSDLTDMTYISTSNAHNRDIQDLTKQCEAKGLTMFNISKRSTMDAALVDVALDKGFAVVSDILIPDIYQDTIKGISCPDLKGNSFSICWSTHIESDNLFRVIDEIKKYDWRFSIKN